MIPRRSRRDERPKVTDPLLVGSRVDAVCSRCKRTTPHVLIRKLGSKPTSVQCSVCAVEHAFRAPRPASAAPALPSTATPEDVWRRSMSRARGVAIPYAMTGHYAVGQKLSHASFGDGVVAALPSSTVCEVIFANGRTKLLMRG